MSLLVLDAATEDFVETSVCVSGRFEQYNKTMIRQVWTVDTPGQNDQNLEPTAIVDLLTSVKQPGVWAVHTPLGGNNGAVGFSFKYKN